MQIHELNNYSGSLDDAYLAADNGSDTGKMKTTALTDPLNARIDNIIAGTAPSAAEIVDARLGADGVTYPSLGAAIRDQVTDLKSDLADIAEFGQAVNLWDSASKNQTQQYSERPMVLSFSNREIVANSNTDGSSGVYISFDVEIGKDYHIEFDSSILSNNYAVSIRNYAGYSVNIPLKSGQTYALDFRATANVMYLYIYLTKGQTATLSNINIYDTNAEISTKIRLEVIKGISESNIDDEFLPKILNKDTISPVHYNGHEFCSFSKCLCIGNSLTLGTFNSNETGGVQLRVAEKYSYPTKLTELFGVVTTNVGIGGTTSEGWYTAKKDVDFSGHDVAIIILGENDASYSKQDSDVWIKKIIDKIKAENNGIKIFISTMLPSYYYNYNNYNVVNNNIKKVVTENSDCYLLDMTSYSECLRDTAYVNGHLTALGYQKMAEELVAYCSYVMSQNLNDFKYIQFIGTNYSYTE